MFSSINRNPIENTKTYHRLRLTSNEEFTIPETVALFCSGGGIFRNGIAIGSNESIIPGSLRFVNNKLQYLKNEGWLNVSGFFENNCRENSIAKFGRDGELTDTNILIENNNISGVDVIETEYITPPDNKNLMLGNIQWPTDIGKVNHSLRFVEPGVLEPSTDPVPIYDISSDVNKLLYFKNIYGKIVSSKINVSEYNLSNIGTLSGLNITGGNIHLFSNTIRGDGGLTVTADNGLLNIMNNNNGVNLSTSGIGKISMLNTTNSQKISFGVSPPKSSTSNGNKGDFTWNSEYIYVCTSDNCWKRVKFDDNW